MASSDSADTKSRDFPAIRSACLICTIVVSESLLATVLFPFVYQMVKSFDSIEERYIGFWAGVITSSYFASQAITAFLLGILSDKLGRKPILILGLAGGAIGIVSLGLSKSIHWAIIARAACGLFNGNAGVTRTALGELAHNYSWNQGKTFSLFGLCSAIGYIFGPVVGGYLSNPVERFALHGPWGIFVVYPFLLPCCIIATFNLLVIGMSLVFLEETKAPINPPEDVEALDAHIDETEALLTGRSIEPEVSKSKTQGVYSRTVIACVVSLGFLSLHAIVFDENFPIFASTPPPQGLGFTPSQTGLTLSLMGPIVLASSLFLYPYLNTWVSTLILCQFTATIFGVVYVLFSLIPNISTHDRRTTFILQMLSLFSLMGARFAINVISYTALGVLLNQIAAPETRGAVMGFAQTAMSLGRALGPAFGGMVWSWSLGNGLPAPMDSHFLYLIETAFAISQLVATLEITPS